jgi:hypothetical protein
MNEREHGLEDYRRSEAPRAQPGASPKRHFFNIVPLDPTCKAGLAVHLPVILSESLTFS